LLILRVADQEFHTILAALRFYQGRGQGEPVNHTDAIQDIATSGREVVPLDAAGIDNLCERLNTGHEEETDG